MNCRHTFCFLCIKGIRSSSAQKKCALCRIDFSLEALEQELAFVSEATNDQPEQLAQWFYSGKSGNGWWQYDDRTSKDIEEAFEDPEKKSVVISIVGFMYKIDFEVKIIKLPEVI